ncbi:uncharacterized protein LOC131946110 isoform X2 [Physella acuta]|nr:uncharacterized protein LOC131946110 isoform X2 [Physella acuta]
MSPIWIFVLLPTLTLGDALSDAKALQSSMDVNKDGELTEDEIAAALITFDVNTDKSLSMDELKNFAEAHLPSIVQPTLVWGQHVDTNKDGKICHTEFDAEFKAIFGNKNGAYAALLERIEKIGKA